METSPVTGVKISSVVPASVTGENKPRQFTPMDLVMKLHYVRTVYFFKNTHGFTVTNLKTSMFTLLQSYYHVSGRIRMPENDKDFSAPAIPYIRCNDSGIRIVEANVQDFTVEEWLGLEDRSIDHRFLVYNHILGPDLIFSSLVFLQITQFKCGGFSIGLSWAHILGDVFSASTFMKALGQLMSGHGSPKLVYQENPELAPHAHVGDGDGDDEAFSIKKIDSVGQHWLLANKCKMGRYIFNISLDQIDRLMAKYKSIVQPVSEVDILYALIWKCLVKIRGESNTNAITVCDRKKSSTTCSNDDLVISVVEKKKEKLGIYELAALVATETRNKNGVIKQMIEKDRGSSDFITYGANLTLVNLVNINMCEFEIKGEKPEFVNYTIDGVGDKGLVLVFPKGKFARTISVVMPEEELAKLKDEVFNIIS